MHCPPRRHTPADRAGAGLQGVYARGGPLTVDVPQDSFEAFVSRDDTGRRSPAVSCGSRTPGALTPGALTPTASYVASTRKARPSFGGEVGWQGGSGAGGSEQSPNVSAAHGRGWCVHHAF